MRGDNIIERVKIIVIIIVREWFFRDINIGSDYERKYNNNIKNHNRPVKIIIMIQWEHYY